MPHIIIEHTNDIDDVAGLVRACHSSLGNQDTVAITSLKTRSILVENAVVGDNASDSMVHITVKLLPGRSDELLTKMANDLHVIACAHCSASAKTSITVETMTLHQPSYQK